ncbi:SMI1/KNR4 family protein [Rhodococcus sp. NPDC059234]|uniref:SMI1/KNR4 family protein n=1 Tax=Rhodococcus sp. NPDC059234 TaxID=3346781 RepID=UPI00366EC50E
MSVEANWARIIRWCEQHAPKTPTRLLPPADLGAVRSAEAATAETWPEQLFQWFALHDGGYREYPIPLVLPSNEPLSVADAVETRHRLTRSWEDEAEDLGGTEALMAEPAGSETEIYLPAFIPIGDTGAGDYLAVDTRGGDRSGCVIEFFNEGGATFRWASIEAMLDCTASALEHGTDCVGWVALVEDGVLRWDFA